MLGLDRAIITTQFIEFDADKLKFNILNKFGIKDDFHCGNNEKIYLGKEENLNPKFKYINWIKINKKIHTLNKDRCKVIIEINYPKFFRETNFELVNQQKDKENVDFSIRLILSEVFETSPEKLKLDYSDLEAGEQINIKKFSDYTNVLHLVYKAFNNSFSSDSKCLFGDYSTVLDRFYITGFNFKIEKGLVLKAYNKTLENNKKNKDHKVSTGGVLRGEFNMTTSIIKQLMGTTEIDNITLDRLKKAIKTNLEDGVKKAIKEQLKYNQKELESRLSKINITPKNIELFVTENNEWILDDEIFSSILKKELTDKKSERMIRRCKKTGKEKLILLENSNSPKRSNTKNIKRLKEFLINIFGLEIEIQFSKDGEIQIF